MSSSRAFPANVSETAMPLINVKDFAVNAQRALLQNNLYVLFGDAYLVNQSLKRLLEALGQADMDTFYGNDDREVTQALSLANTYPLLGDGRVVLLKDADFLQNAADKAQLLESAQKAYEEKDIKAACKYVLSYLSAGNLALEDALPQNKGVLSDALTKEPFFDEVVAACLKDNLKPKKAEQGADLLFAALERGLPDVNKLVITAAGLDKRRKVFKALEEKGLLVDCGVPKGDFKADKDAQNEILRREAAEFERRTGKKLDPKAVLTLTELIGFDLYAINAAFAQLADYAGARPRITPEDVKALFSRTKSDPIFELTNAVAQADLGQSLFFLDSLLTNAKMHPLQVLAAIANQMRKIAAARSFLDSPQGRGFFAGQSYQQFQREGLALVQAYDAELQAVLTGWENQLAPEDLDGADKPKGKKAKKSAVIGQDFLLAKDGKSAYPVYLLLQNAAKYPTACLPEMFRLLLGAESALKMSASNPKLLLEKLLLDLFALTEKKR